MSAESAPLQSISIPRTEKRTLPTPHVVYAVVITLPVRSWTVYHRYSEFVTLHQTFTTSKQFVRPPPAALPPKHAARKTLSALTGLGGLVPRGESAREEDANMQEERRAGLEKYVRAIVASQDPVWRESDEFCAFIELSKGRSSASTLLGVQGQASRRTTQRYVPGSFTSEASERNNTIHTPSTATKTTRTLGAAPIRESQATRTLDDSGLMSAHQDQMDAQDRQLEGLAAVLRRQKAMGLAINQELSEQTDLLDDLDQHVDRTQSKMHAAGKQMDRL